MTVSLTKIVWIRVRVHENLWRIWCFEVLDTRSYRTENIIGNSSEVQWKQQLFQHTRRVL